MARNGRATAATDMEAVRLTHRRAPERDQRLGAFGAPGIRVERVFIGSTAGFDYSWSGSFHYLALHDLQLQDGETFSDFGRPSRLRDLRGTLSFVPVGARIWGWSQPHNGNPSFTALYFDPSTMEAELARRIPEGGARGRVYFSDPALRSTLDKIKRVMSEGEAYDSMYLESLCLVAALEAATSQARGEVIAQSSGQLTRAMAQQTIDFIDANIGGKISLSDLAGVAGLSRFHFIRVFRQTFGTTPYQFVLNRRIERARALLVDGRKSLDEIATAVGFDDAARLGRAFRRSETQRLMRGDGAC